MRFSDRPLTVQVFMSSLSGLVDLNHSIWLIVDIKSTSHVQVRHVLLLRMQYSIIIIRSRL